MSADATRGELLTFLKGHPHLLETNTGWVDALRLADGVALTHELSAAEREADVLAADDDLALWAALAGAGLPLKTGGQVRARPDDGAAGRGPQPFSGRRGEGLIGQGLVGPRGWLADLRAGDLLEVRLRGGVMEVRATEPPEYRATQLAALYPAFTVALAEAVERYGKGDGDIPAADIAGVLVELLLTRPEVLADPLPPLGTRLGRMGWETFAGHVGLPAPRGTLPASGA